MILRERKSRSGPYSVLIVCEGENTEPAYFFEFENYLNEHYSKDYPNGIRFSIFPYPPQERELRDDDNQLFTRIKGRQAIQNFGLIVSEDVENEYLAEPTRWVRFAQKQAIGAGYNGIWSVFDFDNRSLDEIARAFKLAKDEEGSEDCIVKIAYSSYSFEYWLLLHYELYEKYIEGSECKDEDRQEIYCGKEETDHPDNCKGAKCLGGYLRINSYEVGSYNKTKKSTFPPLIPFLKKARYNAAYIRNSPKNKGVDLWRIKPITNVDELIDSFIPGNLFIEWQYLKGKILFGNCQLKWDVGNNGIINIEILRKNKQAFVIPENKIKLYNSDYESFSIKERVQMETTDSYKFGEIKISEIEIAPEFISVETNGKIYISKIF